MTGLWLEYLFWDEKAIQTLSERMSTRHKATQGPWNGCTWGNPYHKLDWQGELHFFPSTRVSEKLKGNHSASGTRTGNCLYMRVSNCSGIKRIRTRNANTAGMKGGEDMAGNPQALRNGTRIWSHRLQMDLGRLLVEGNELSSILFAADSVPLNRKGRWEFLQNLIEHESGKPV